MYACLSGLWLGGVLCTCISMYTGVVSLQLKARLAYLGLRNSRQVSQTVTKSDVPEREEGGGGRRREEGGGGSDVPVSPFIFQYLSFFFFLFQ